jgi:hypothetical protein
MSRVPIQRETPWLGERPGPPKEPYDDKENGDEVPGAAGVTSLQANTQLEDCFMALEESMMNVDTQLEDCFMALEESMMNAMMMKKTETKSPTQLELPVCK